MFPIADSVLPIPKIADYWSREINPTASRQEIQFELELAWWRGELAGTKSPPTRLGLLKGLIRACRDSVVFLAGADAGPPTVRDLEDGSVEVDIRPRIRLPSSPQHSWTDRDCVAPFKEIATQWEEIITAQGFELVLPSVRAIKVSRVEFERWRAARGAKSTKFWGKPSEAELKANSPEAQRPSDDEVRALIREAMEGKGGFISQKNGAEIVREQFPGFIKKKAMALVKGLTHNEKPGPRGPRNNSANKRA